MRARLPRRHDDPKAIHFFMGIDDANSVGKSDSAKDREQRPEQGYG